MIVDDSKLRCDVYKGKISPILIKYSNTIPPGHPLTPQTNRTVKLFSTPQLARSHRLRGRRKIYTFAAQLS